MLPIIYGISSEFHWLFFPEICKILKKISLLDSNPVKLCWHMLAKYLSSSAFCCFITFLPSWKGYFFIWVICPLARRFWLIKGVGFFTSNPVLHDFFLCLQPSHPLVQTEIKNHKGYGLCDAFPAEFNNHSKTLALLLSTYKSLFSVEITAYYLSHLNNLFHTSEQHNKATHPD